MDYRGRQRIVETGTAVVCAGVVVAPGDWVLAEADGIVVVPRDVLCDCLEIATGRLRGESKVLDDLLAGDTLGTVWDRYGLL